MESVPYEAFAGNSDDCFTQNAPKVFVKCEVYAAPLLGGEISDQGCPENGADGNVLDLCCLSQLPLATCGHGALEMWLV